MTDITAEVTDPNYPDNQTAEVDLTINADLVDTRGEGDENADN